MSNRRILIYKVTIGIMLEDELGWVEPIVEGLATQNMLVNLSEYVHIIFDKKYNSEINSPFQHPSKVRILEQQGNRDQVAGYRSRELRMPSVLQSISVLKVPA
jgi:hypothetical protein